MAPAASAAAPKEPPPGRITIQVLSMNGSGCPPHTAAVAAAEDNTAFTVTYSEHTAQAGGNSSPADQRKFCQLDLGVHVPQGFTYAIAGTDYRGYAKLADGASGLVRAVYYHQGVSRTTSVSHTIHGKYSKSWQFTDRNPVAELVWKPCGEDRNFHIDAELRVDEGTSKPEETSFISFDSTDSRFGTVYHFEWKQCPGH
nr:DUF4360 domain-containing protein [Actinomadura rubrisoli]